MNSRQKGAAGEREFAKFLTGLGVFARRGQQFSGSKESPDVVSDLPIHIEVKRVETLNIRAASAQAERDSCGKPWAVFHRRNHGKWMATVDAEYLVRLIAKSMDPIPEP